MQHRTCYTIDNTLYVYLWIGRGQLDTVIHNGENYKLRVNLVPVQCIINF